eukprot:5870254-Prymnesium_polylepis.1
MARSESRLSLTLPVTLVAAPENEGVRAIANTCADATTARCASTGETQYSRVLDAGFVCDNSRHQHVCGRYYCAVCKHRRDAVQSWPTMKKPPH